MPRVLESIHLRLDSSRPDDASWTFSAARPRLLLHCDAHSRIASLRGADGLIQSWDDPLAALDWMEQHMLGQPADSTARWIGYLSYDLGRLFEDLPTTTPDDLNIPLFSFAFVDRAAQPIPRLGGSLDLPEVAARSNFSKTAYCSAVTRVIEYIGAGDVFQVNLSQRFTLPLIPTPAEVYARLQDATPAWYGAYLDFGDHALLCNSPELFLRVDCRHITTRPIKGTRPRIAGMDQELRASVKDQAELNMIVDLERNDLGRVCRTGSVKVPSPRTIETHPTVYHGATTVEGELRDDVSLVDLLRATFPGGSVTGAPKIRAMQIIEELEPIRRGPYCGAIGYLAAGGRMQFNVAIRTMIAKGGFVHVPVGGGVVADSQPEEEYEETLVKARAMFAAVGGVVGG